MSLPPVRVERARAAATASQAPLLPVRHGVGSSILTFWLGCCCLGAVWLHQSPSGFWFAAGSVACLIVSVPILSRRYDVISPWSLVIAGTYLACGVRGLFISLGIDGTRTLDQLYFLGHRVDYFVEPTLVYLLGLLLFAAGYVFGRRRRVRARKIFATQPSFVSERVLLVVVVCAVAGFAGFVLFARSTGGFSWDLISAKRTAITGLDLDASYRSHGEYRVLADLSPIAFWIQLAHYAHSRRPHGVLTLRGVWLGVLFLNAVLFPLYASNRAEVMWLIAGAVVIEYCLGGRIRVIRTLGWALVGVISITAITSLRGADDGSFGGVDLDTGGLVDAFVLSRTLADIPTSGNIINAVPERLPRSNGGSIVAWFAAPIPRSLWPEKPIISSGPTLGVTIYGNRRSGVPPGLVAESYWNFGSVGVLVLPAAAGFAVRRVGDRWRPYARSSPAAAVVMGAVGIQPGVDLLANSIGAAPYQAVVTLVLLAPVLALIARPEPRTVRDRDEGRGTRTIGTRVDHRSRIDSAVREASTGRARSAWATSADRRG